jgi:hypothetical protein
MHENVIMKTVILYDNYILIKKITITSHLLPFQAYMHPFFDQILQRLFFFSPVLSLKGYYGPNGKIHRVGGGGVLERENFFSEE